MIVIVLTLVLGFGVGPTMAQDKAPRTKEWKVEFKQLPSAMQRHILKSLKEKGVDGGAKAITFASSSTKNCPSTCNDSSGGGFCFCQPDSSGNCGAGETKGGSPGSEYCKVAMPKINVGIDGRAIPLEVQMP
jgi:hypothetical protein